MKLGDKVSQGTVVAVIEAASTVRAEPVEAPTAKSAASSQATTSVKHFAEATGKAAASCCRSLRRQG